MKWSADGSNLAIIVARYPKKKGKNLTYQISVVRLSERNAPIDVPFSVVDDVDSRCEWHRRAIRVGASELSFRHPDRG